MGFTDENIQRGNPQMIVEGMAMPILFDGRKMFQHIRKTTEEDLLNLTKVKIIVSSLHDSSSDTFLQSQQKIIKKCRSKIPIEEWRKRLAMAPDDVINHVLDKHIPNSYFVGI